MVTRTRLAIPAAVSALAWLPCASGMPWQAAAVVSGLSAAAVVLAAVAERHRRQARWTRAELAVLWGEINPGHLFEALPESREEMR